MLALWLMLFASEVHAEAVTSENTGHAEILLAGAGSARLGASGSMGTNPALLGWHVRDETFTNTNSLSFIKTRSLSDQTKTEVRPVFLPLYSASTQRDGNWGRGFALTTREVREFFTTKADVVSQEQRISSAIAIDGGIARRFRTWGLGVNLGVQRSTEETSTTFSGSPSGVDVIGHSNTTTTFWSSKLKLGAAGSLFKESSWGLMVGHPFMTWAVQSSTTTVTYDSLGASIDRDTNTSVPFVGRRMNAAGGVRTKFGKDTYVNFEADWKSDYSDGSAHYHGVWGGAAGLEMPWWEKLTAYSGLRLSSSSQITGENENTAASTLVSAGMRQKFRYASTLYGVTYNQSMDSTDESTFAFIFGTSFIY